jgi:hypothetical protein
MAAAESSRRLWAIAAVISASFLALSALIITLSIVLR